MTGRLRSVIRAALVALTGATLNSCALDQREERAIDAWLNCDECVDGEREAVRRIGAKAIPRLESALRDGPDATRLATMREKFNAIHGWAAARGDKASFVAFAEQNYVANYQKRAALALRDIGTPRATQALRSALSGSYRPDVAEVIQYASSTIDTAKFTGTITPSSAVYGDTVVVRPPAYQPFDGNELLAVDTTACDPDDPPVALSATRMTVLIAGQMGARTLTICNVGPTNITQTASFVIRSVDDPNDRRMSACTDLACRISMAPLLIRGQLTPANPVTAKLSLWKSVSSQDTLDFFKFQPVAATSVTAELEWGSSADLDLRWISCTGPPTGNTDGATSSRPERTTFVIPAGSCTVLLVHLKSDAALEHVRLRLTTP